MEKLQQDRVRAKTSEAERGSFGAALWLGITNGVIALFGVAHLLRVTMKAAEREVFYDFRLYSLYILGVLLMVPSLRCLLSLRGIRRGLAAAWSRAWASTWLLLLVCAPTIPLEYRFHPYPYAPWNPDKPLVAVASLTVLLLLLNIISLVLARPRCRDGAPEAAS